MSEAVPEPDHESDLAIRAMTQGEVVELVGWAADEGWNPGRSDASLFWQTDAQGFIAAELDGDVIGGGSVAAYGQDYGFMGLFIMKPTFRGRGLGRRLWRTRRDLLRARLAPDAPIGMDGVDAMVPFYTAGGFALSHLNRRFRFTGRRAAVSEHVQAAASMSLGAIAAFDREHFPASREAFLRGWLTQSGSQALVRMRGDEVAGLGVIRPCLEGHKIGPLFAESGAIAEELLDALQQGAVGEPVFLDVPDINPGAQDLVHRHAMEEVFSCSRMYLGPPPRVKEHQIFGVTTFELG